VRDDPSVVRLVTRARGGEQAAWDEIVTRYAPLIWGMCRRHGLSGMDIDDVGACVWLRLVERIETIRDPAALPGWLATTARNECLRLLRSRSQHIAMADNESIVVGAEPAADEWLLTQERHIALRAALSRLPQRCQQLLSLLFRDPPTPYAEISTIVGAPIGAIGPTRQRCLELLRASPSLARLHDAQVSEGAT
jgi:RNA polymerase sigma factor (sigma-70 family)